MVESVLNEKLIEDGRSLVQSLDDSGIDVQGALWFYFSEQSLWRLLIETPMVESAGPRDTYSKIQSSLSKLKKQGNSLSLDEVALAKPEADLLKLLRLMVSTDSGLHSMRFSNNMINGQLIEDAFIYRLKKK
ncbi:MAG: hypothetical protein KDA57_21080 [Planctomycetales bacterium]|nr:hypothetical protein [Planctomycetales bacterium]